MDMDSSSHACKISMLWNWYTVDACFLSTQWHIRSHGAFAGSVIAVFLTTALVEGVRRAAREYDRKLIAQAPLHSRNAESAPLAGPSAMKSMSFLNLPMCFSKGPGRVRPTLLQQLVRAAFFGVQFTVAYLLMLLAMYYNGYMLMAIILGGTAGYAVFSADTLGETTEEGGVACC